MWKMKKTIFAIAEVWNQIVAENDLKVKDVVQIWSFKFMETGRHGLAMVKIGATSASDTTCISPSPTLSLMPPQSPSTADSSLSVAETSPTAADTHISLELSLTPSQVHSPSYDYSRNVAEASTAANTHISLNLPPQSQSTTDSSLSVAEAGTAATNTHISLKLSLRPRQVCSPDDSCSNVAKASPDSSANAHISLNLPPQSPQSY